MVSIARRFHSFGCWVVCFRRVIRFGFYPCPGDGEAGLYNSSSCPLVLRASFSFVRRGTDVQTGVTCTLWARRLRRASIIKTKQQQT